MNRVVRVTVGVLAGAAAGAGLGLAWFDRFGSDEEIFGDFVAAVAGVVVGGLAGGAWGSSFPEWRRSSPLARTLSLLAWLGCGALLLIGIVYIGSWTDSDGPSTEAMIGILGIPVGLGGVWIVARMLRSHRKSSPD